jgi:hypothetical protein
MVFSEIYLVFSLRELRGIENQLTSFPSNPGLVVCGPIFEIWTFPNTK